MPKPDQKPFFSAAMNASSRWFLSSEPSHGPTDWWKTDEKAVAGVAAFLQLLAGQQNMGKTQLIPWMTGISGAGPGEPVGIRRAAVVVFAKNRHVLENVLEKCMELFGDQLYIKHTPSIQQESKSTTSFISFVANNGKVWLKFCFLLPAMFMS